VTDIIRTRTTSGTFGAGGDEPYHRALRDGHDAVRLRPKGARGSDAGTLLPVSRYLGAATRIERRLIGELPGPVLDIGCGPGRMVAAALHAGHGALGIDVSAAAVALAVDQRLPVIEGSVFDRLPREGLWGSALLIDGNIGIGGAPMRLLRRCAELVALGGWIVVEAHQDATRNTLIDGELVDASGGTSAAFPWAEVGEAALRGYARRAGLEPVHDWRSPGGRVFVAYSTRS
jgi:SAM-dependent methyltransferase